MKTPSREVEAQGLVIMGGMWAVQGAALVFTGMRAIYNFSHFTESALWSIYGPILLALSTVWWLASTFGTALTIERYCRRVTSGKASNGCLHDHADTIQRWLAAINGMGLGLSLIYIAQSFVVVTSTLLQTFPNIGWILGLYSINVLYAIVKIDAVARERNCKS